MQAVLSAPPAVQPAVQQLPYVGRQAWTFQAAEGTRTHEPDCISVHVVGAGQGVRRRGRPVRAPGRVPDLCRCGTGWAGAPSAGENGAAGRS